MKTININVKSEINFVEANALENSDVVANYQLDGIHFSILWYNHAQVSGGVDYCMLDTCYKSESEAVRSMVTRELKKGEDSELYLFVSDTFDASNCADLASK